MHDTLINIDIAKEEIEHLMMDTNDITFNKLIANEFTKSFENSNFETDSREHSRLRAAVVHFNSDHTDTCMTILFGYYLIKNPKFKGRINQYYLSYIHSKSHCYNSTCCTGDAHGDDFPLVSSYPFLFDGFTDDDRYMSRVLLNIWTNFAKTRFDRIFNDL